MSIWSDRFARERRGRVRTAAVRYTGRLRDPRQNKGLTGRWLFCALAALLVAGLNYLPFAFAEDCRRVLSYCFQPGAASGTRLEVWADWQPNGERVKAVWQRLLGSQEEDGGLAYPCTGRISSGYGWRYHPVSGQLEMHYGVDIVSEEGSPVQSAGSGTVIEVRNDENLGLCVVVDHGQGLVTEYCHLQSSSVAVGDNVVKGEEIAKVGRTGVTNEPHLHFSLLFNGQPEDPLPRLQNER